MTALARTHAGRATVAGLSLLAMVAALTVAEPARPARSAEPGVAQVYVARGFVFADALAGAVAAALNGAPILLVPGGDDDSIPDVVRDELTRLEPQEIVILGGPEAISPAVETALQEFTDGPVTRLDGLTRFGTAVEIAEIVPSKVADADNLDGKDSSQFVASTGAITVSGRTWQAGVPADVEFTRSDVTDLVRHSSTTGGTATVTTRPDLATALFGEAVELTGAELCYDATAVDVTINTVSLSVIRHSDGAAGTPVATSEDVTPRDDATCRTYTFDDPVGLTAEDTVTLDVTAAFTDGVAQLGLGRATFTLQPAT